MVIGVVRVELMIPWASSLKDKRKIVRSLCDRVRSKFKVAASEVGAVDRWQRAIVGIVCISGSRMHTNKMIDEIETWLQREAGDVISRCGRELIGDVWGDEYDD